MRHLPSFSVVVPTRYRPQSLARTVSSLLELKSPPTEIVVIDQSDADDGRAALAEQLDAGVRWVAGKGKGSARARNQGLRECCGDWVIFVDDDCEVPSDFMDGVCEAIAAFPQGRLFFGRVEAAVYDCRQGIIPASEPASDHVAIRIPQQAQIGAMGACIVGERRCLLCLHGMDVQLGPGTDLRAAEELDLVLRALAAGLPVVETRKFRVVHHGFRPRAELDGLVDGYLLGTGAAYAKLARQHPIAAARLLARVGLRWAFSRPILLYTPKPARLARVCAFSRGFAKGLRIPIDHASGHFVDVLAGATS